MDRGEEREGSEAKNEEGGNRHGEEEEVSAASNQEDTNSDSRTDTCGTGGRTGGLCTKTDVMNNAKEEPPTHEGSVAFEFNSNSDNKAPRLHLETPQRETPSPAPGEEEEAEDEGATAAAADKADLKYEEYRRLLGELCNESDDAIKHSNQLQMTLARYFKKAGDSIQLERGQPEETQLQKYEHLINTVTDLKQQFPAALEAAQQQAEDLRPQSEEKLAKVENEWRALKALKRDTVVKVLSGRLGKEAARAKVEAALQAEQLRQDKLIKLRVKHLELKMRVGRLEAELHGGEEHIRDPILIQFERLLAERPELCKQAEKQNEESSKLQKKISSGLEVLSNIKEKLYWSHIEVETKRKQLAEAEAMMARKREHLTRIKQEHKRLQRGNLRLKEHRGLLGNRVLLRDFEDTVDASDQLEERVQNLKCRQDELRFSCGRWKKKLESF